MTAEDQLQNRSESNCPQPDTKDEQEVTTLTDFFDQLECAAFKRTLAHRDARREAVKAPDYQSK